MNNLFLMKNITSEDIMKLTFDSFPLLKNFQIFSEVKSKLLFKALLRIIDNEIVYTTIGNTKTILKGHTNWISSLTLLPSNQLVSASQDCKLKLWNTNNSTCTSTLEVRKPINSLITLPNGNLAACSYDAIKIFDNKLECLKTICIEENKNFHNLFLLSNGNMAYKVSSRTNNQIIILDRIKYKCIKALQDETRWKTYFANLSEDKFATSSNKTGV
jgi:WD40 repeat protein